MPMELVVNELSLSPPCNSLPLATERMRLFFQLLTAIQKQAGGARPVLRTPVPLNEWLLTRDYAVKRWRNEPTVDRDLRNKLRALQANWPAVSEEAEPDLASARQGSEYLHQGQSAEGLGLAWVLDGLAVSLNPVDWPLHQVPLTERRIESDTTIHEQEVAVRHASTADHADLHAQWLRPPVEIADGLDLWTRRGTLLPSLQLCARVERQLRELDRGHPLLDQILHRLLRLEAYVATWTSGTFHSDSLGFKVTPQSQATLTRYPKDHTFTCPDGAERLFSWHLRLTPGAWRVYFEPEHQSRFFIGHIGAKLPTVSE